MVDPFIREPNLQRRRAAFPMYQDVDPFRDLSFPGSDSDRPCIIDEMKVRRTWNSHPLVDYLRNNSMDTGEPGSRGW